MLITAAIAMALAQAQAWPDPETARKKFRLAPGLDMTLWAADPHLRNPVALAFDEKGRLFVAEDNRRHTSLLDIHMRKEWLDDDLACRKHDDIAAYHLKRLGPKAKDWEVEAEKILLLEDRDGDGRCDASTVFSEGYTAIGEGIGAGVLARKGDVYYTCIPNLWKLRDRDGDGKADEKTSLARGFGVHLGASGHDMHGLRFGPDGKLYWSHGDRGFHVEKDGKIHSFPDGGGVFRCNPDGSEFEVVCVGLRNPQELAFDKFGNLFTGDNNISKAPDVGETCRWTYVVEGADYGWRIGYQFMSDGGAWIAEEQWKGKALFTVPAVAFLGHGPSGVTYHPGGGPLARYAERFFMCDYPGGIYSFAMKPKGASFEMVDLEKTLWEITAPDVEVGWDGALWVADWVGLWDKTDKGRVWRITDPSAPKELDVPRLMAEGFEKKAPGVLLALMNHADQRVRQEAQFELAARKDVDILRLAAAKGPLMVRIHAIWALGQVGETAPVVALLGDEVAEIRAQAAKVCGDRREKAAFDGLLARLKDESPRVRHFAARGLGRLKLPEAVPALIDFLKGQEDRVLLHAGAMALAEIGRLEKAEALEDRTVRLAALLALRKLGRPEIARYLEDADPALVTEAARAIWDQELAGARPALAKLLANPGAPERALLRAANAAFALGDAKALAACAADQQFPARVRVEALRILGDWAQGVNRDRLLGLWRPVPGRPAAEARAALGAVFEAVLTAYDAAVAAEGVKAARALGLEGVGDALAKLVRSAAAGAVRAEALRALGDLKDPRTAELAEAALADVDADMRIEGLRRLAPDDPRLERIAADPGVPKVRQAAVAALGEAALGRLLDRWIAGDWPAALQLDLLEGASKRPALKEKLAKVEAPGFRECLEGGDAENGRRIFFQRNDAQCVRCHAVGTEGGTVGPPLTQLGGQKTREYLLEAIVTPNKAIAEGWGQTAFQMQNGDVEVGRIEKETDAEVLLVLPDGLKKTLRKGAIAQRKAGLSAMPEDAAKRLSRRDLRDLVEFLSTLR